MKWQTGEPPEGALVLFQVEYPYRPDIRSSTIENILGRNEARQMIEPVGFSRFCNAGNVKRWVLLSDVLAAIEGGP